MKQALGSWFNVLEKYLFWLNQILQTTDIPIYQWDRAALLLCRIPTPKKC